MRRARAAVSAPWNDQFAAPHSCPYGKRTAKDKWSSAWPGRAARLHHHTEPYAGSVLRPSSHRRAEGVFYRINGKKRFQTHLAAPICICALPDERYPGGPGRLSTPQCLCVDKGTPDSMWKGERHDRHDGKLQRQPNLRRCPSPCLQPPGAGGGGMEDHDGWAQRREDPQCGADPRADARVHPLHLPSSGKAPAVRPANGRYRHQSGQACGHDHQALSQPAGDVLRRPLRRSRP